MKIKIITYLVLLAGFFIIYISCGKGEQAAGSQQQQAMPFPVVKVEKRDVTSYRTYPANLEGEVSSDIRPKIAGYIKSVLVREGQPVKQGQVMFQLETQSLSQQAQAAKAAVNTAQVEVEKLKPLVEKNIISNVQLETAKANLEQAKSNYNSIVANIDYAHVKSPVNGLVGYINYRKGSLVSAQDPLPLTRVSSIKNVYAYFSMNEKGFLDFIETTGGKTMQDKIDQMPKVQLKLANGSMYGKEGTIETISGNINEQTGTVSIRVKFDNTEGLLRDGSSGTIIIPKKYSDALVLPAQSTFERQGKTIVYKVANDSLIDTPILVADEAGKVYVVSSGVEAGETILAKGFNKVTGGSKIQPIMTPMDSILNSFNTVFK